MNVDELQKLIKDGLVASGKTRVPVVPPGTPISVMPCVVLAPSDDTLESGNKTLKYGFDITCCVPRGGQVSQYGLLVEIEAIVLQSLIPSNVRFDGPLRFAATGGEATGEPPALARIIPISFSSDVDLCP